MSFDSARANAAAGCVLQILVLAPSLVFAQSGRPTPLPPPPGVPGAGTIIQEVEPVMPPAPPGTGPALSVPATPEGTGPDSAPFKVNALRITGNTVFDAATLHAVVAPAESQDLTLRQVTELAGRIGNFYHAHGYPFARAILPAQTIEGGVVTIEVLEARYDTISLENHSRVRDAVLRATLQQLQAGRLIAGPALDRALLRVSDIPGVTPNATLAPGAAVGTSALRVIVTSAPLLTGSVSVDNYGDRYTGEVRGGGTVTLTEPLGLGDVLSANVLSSGGGLNDGRVSYDVLVDGMGTRAGGAFSQLHYLLGDSLQALDGHGIAQVESAWVKQPMVRTATGNLYGQIEFDHKRLDDELGANDIHTDRHLDNWTASLAGDWRDTLLAGGVNSWSAGATAGTLGFDNVAARGADAFTARTEGHYVKWTASVARLQALGPKDAVYLALSGQGANQNLDPAEKLVAGGPYSVRGYAVSAVSGDIGYLGSLEYRHELGRTAGVWQGVLFVDGEHLTIDKNLWTGGPDGATLTAAGGGINWSGPRQWSAKVFAAAPFGAAPVLVGPTRSARVWGEIDKGF